MSRKPNPNRPRYSRLIGEARRAKGWTQAQLAEAVGLEETTIRKHEAGQRAPSFDDLYNICSVLDLNVYDVMDVDLRHGGGSDNYREYVARPFQKVLSTLEDNITVVALTSDGYTDDDISVIFDGKEAHTTKTELILQAASIRKRLQDEYKKRLAEELNKLVKDMQ